MTEKTSIDKLPVVLDMAEQYHLTGPSLVHTVRTVAVDGKISETELLSCLMVAKEHGLNPLTREIYFIKGKAKKDKATGKYVDGLVQPIVSVDGWIKKCNSHPQFDGMEFSDTVDDKGKLVSITCKIYRKDRGRPTVVTEYMAECRPKDASFGPWVSHPSRMLRHRALIQCARIAFGFAGVMDPDEFKTWQDGIKDVTPAAEAPSFDEIEAEMEAEPEVEDVEIETVDMEEWLASNGGVIQVGNKMMKSDQIIAQIKEEMDICADMESVDEVLEQWDEIIQKLPRSATSHVESAYEEAKVRIEEILEGEQIAC